MNFKCLNLARVCFLFSLFAFTFISCFKEDPPAPEPNPTETPLPRSTVRDLLDDKYLKSYNSTMSEDGYVNKSANNLFYVTLPLSLSSTTAIVEFVTSKNSAVKVNNVTVTTNAAKHNNQDVMIAITVVNIENVITVEMI